MCLSKWIRWNQVAFECDKSHISRSSMYALILIKTHTYTDMYITSTRIISIKIFLRQRPAYILCAACGLIRNLCPLVLCNTYLKRNDLLHPYGNYKKCRPILSFLIFRMARYYILNDKWQFKTKFIKYSFVKVRKLRIQWFYINRCVKNIFRNRCPCFP